MPRKRQTTQRQLLHDKARYASRLLLVDDVRVDVGINDPSLVDAIELRGFDGRSIGRAGWSAARAKHPAAVIEFVANGVVVESLARNDLARGFIALVHAEDLERDLSQAKLVRDDAFARRVEAVRRAHSRVLARGPSLAPSAPGRGLGDVAVPSGISLLMLVPGVIAMVAGQAVGAVFVGLGLGLAVLAGHHGALELRRLRVLRHGRAHVATVVSAERTGLSINNVPELAVELVFPADDEHPRGAAIRLPVPGHALARFAPGRRVYVRVDPDDASYVVLETE
jgi:hypothetical protein